MGEWCWWKQEGKDKVIEKSISDDDGGDGDDGGKKGGGGKLVKS